MQDDYIECPICHRKFKYFLSERHIKPSHGLTREDFLKLYPGYKMTSDSYRKYISDKSRKDWKSGNRESRILKVKSRLNDPEVKKKISDNSKRMWETPGFREQNSHRIKDGLLNSDFCKLQSDRMIHFWGDTDNKEERSKSIKEGISSSDTFHDIHSKCAKYQWSNAELRAKRISSIKKSLSVDSEVSRRSKASKKYWSKESSRKKQSDASKSNWKNKVFVDKVTKGYNRCKYVTKSGETIYLRSSYEITTCEYLDSLGVNYSYQSKGFKYFYNGGYHTYWPDFFLDWVIIEVKPKSLVDRELVQVKYNSVKSLGYNIIFITEDDLVDIGTFKNSIGVQRLSRKLEDI